MTGPLGTPRAEALANAWQAARPRFVRIAYAVLASRTEAEDVVADCWPRLVSADAREPVESVEAWGTVAVAHAALDVLRSARVRREVYPGPWLPEPVVRLAVEHEPAPDPADRVTLDESVSWALLLALEALSPAERTAWVLHDLFGVPFPEVARTVGRTPVAVRQLAARARAHVRAHTPRVPVSPAEHRAAVDRFLAAAAGGDLSALVAVLDPEVVLTSDGGGVVNAARRPVLGADRVARFLQGVARKVPAGARVVRLDVNGAPGIGVLEAGRLTSVTVLTVADGRVARVDVVRAPAKLAAFHDLPG